MTAPAPCVRKKKGMTSERWLPAFHSASDPSHGCSGRYRSGSSFSSSTSGSSVKRTKSAALENELPDLYRPERSEEHTSELQSQSNLVCRLLLEKKKYDTDLNH